MTSIHTVCMNKSHESLYLCSFKTNNWKSVFFSDIVSIVATKRNEY